MNFDNNHFIDAGNNISGLLYGTKRAYNSLYDGKGKQPSTYYEEVFIYPEPKAVQRSNGFSESVWEAGHGILYGGLDWVYNPINGSYKAKSGVYSVFLWQGGDRWTAQLFKEGEPASSIQESTLAKALKLGLWILTGEVSPEPLV